MQKRCSLILPVLLLANVSAAQTANPQPATALPEQPGAQPATPQQTPDTSNFTSAKGFVLEDSTPLKLPINRTISSGDSKVGDTVDFEVLQDASANGILVIAKGGLAICRRNEREHQSAPYLYVPRLHKLLARASAHFGFICRADG
jgi:hypothetical protein